MGKTTNQKIAGIYDPYIDTLGGGEKYMFTIAQTLLENGYNVDVFTNQSKDIFTKLESRFNLNLANINTKPNIFKKSGPASIIEKYKNTKNYDLFIYLGDGSIPFIFSKKNILHVQVPFNDTPNLTKKILDLVKLSLFKKIIVNSRFTQNRFKSVYHKNSDILYPPIDIQSFTPAKDKQNIILSVGRFDNVLNAKRQDVLVEAFKYLSDKNNLKNWRLVLAGGSIEDEANNQYLSHLKYISKNYPIKFVVNKPFDVIKHLYSISKIYWHAAGFEIDENTNPQSTEHFGMTVVEAMSAGLVPIVVNKGGLKEIVKDDVSGFLWHKQIDLTSKSQFLIGHPNILKKMSIQAQKTSKQFSTDRFINQFKAIIK